MAVIFIFNLSAILMSIPGVIIAVTLHEYAKSLAAFKLGDENVKKQGRLAPNPLKHMDPLGSIFMLIFGYGWANPLKLTRFSFANRKQAMIIIFIVPFLVNIIVGTVFAVCYQLFFLNFVSLGNPNFQIMLNIALILQRVAILNFSFAFFSLIPIYPLDGAQLLATLSPMAGLKIAQAEKILQILLAFVIILGGATFVFGPLVNIIMQALIFI